MSRFPELFDEAIDTVVLGEALLIEVLAEHIARHIVDRQRALARRGANRRPLADAPDDARDRPLRHRRWSR